MAIKVQCIAATGNLPVVLVNGYHQITMIEFIADRVNDYRKREAVARDCGMPLYKVRAPSRPEPDLRRRVGQ